MQLLVLYFYSAVFSSVVKVKGQIKGRKGSEMNIHSSTLHFTITFPKGLQM